MSSIIEREAAHTSGCYPKRQLALVRGAGSWVWGDSGNRYLDLTSGQGVALIGHAHPAVAAAVARQAETLITCPEIFYNDQRAQLLEKLVQITPEGIARAFLCNSGAEANEAAIKFARLFTGRTDIIATQRGFHGRTMGALSATWEPKYREPFQPLVPGFHHIPYDNLDALESALNAQVAAVIVEAVQGEGGVRPASFGYLKKAHQLCKKAGALLIVDEVQTGFGRTGRWFACQYDDMTPDLLTLGKGIAGGVPMGAVAIHERLGTLPPVSHGSTFGGNPLACAAALATVNVLETQDLPTRSAKVGAQLLQLLQDEIGQLPIVRQIRGRGLMIGIELRTRVTPALQKLQELGILALPAGPTVLRLLPPLIIEISELEKAVSAIRTALTEMAADA